MRHLRGWEYEGNTAERVRIKRKTMRIYKADNKFIAVHSTSTTVYTATGKTEQEAKEKVLAMIKKK